MRQKVRPFRFFVLAVAFLSLFAQGFSTHAAGISREIADEMNLRKAVFERVMERADRFRNSASALRLDAESVRFAIQNGWENATQEDIFRQNATENESETDFLLRALDSLGACESVERAKTFARTGTDRHGNYREFSTQEQFRFAAIGFSEGVRESAEITVSVRILAQWKRGSERLILVAVTDSAQCPLPFPEQDSMPTQFACVTGGGTLSDFQNTLIFATFTPNTLAGVVWTASEKLPYISDFRLVNTLSAGRKPILLI